MLQNPSVKTYSDLAWMRNSECYEIITVFVTYPPFRTIEILQLLLSFTSLFSMAYVEFKYVLPFTFHRNMKIILSITYLMGITHALISSSMQVVQVAMTSAKPPCESFAPKWFYETVHMTLTTFTVGMVIMLFMLMCERAIATLLSKKYEVTGVTVGIFLSALGIASSITIILTTYRSSDFNELNPSVLFIPSTAVHRTTRMFLIQVIICCVCVLGMIVLIVMNIRKCTRKGMMLTSRYQIRENIATTKIATYLVGFQTILFLSYTVFGSIVYSYRKRIFGDNLKAFTAARQALYLMPLFTFSLPIFTIILIRRYRSHRSEQIRSIVSLRSTGNEGSRNYGEIMLKIWEKSSK